MYAHTLSSVIVSVCQSSCLLLTYFSQCLREKGSTTTWGNCVVHNIPAYVARVLGRPIGQCGFELMRFIPTRHCSGYPQRWWCWTNKIHPHKALPLVHVRPDPAQTFMVWSLGPSPLLLVKVSTEPKPEFKILWSIKYGRRDLPTAEMESHYYVYFPFTKNITHEWCWMMMPHALDHGTAYHMLANSFSRKGQYCCLRVTTLQPV